MTMSQRFKVGAQLSTSHSSPETLGVERVMDAVERARSIIDLDILIVGAREDPEIFRAMSSPGRRPAREVFLWYNVLSDIEGMQDSDLVVNFRGERSHGWGGWAEKGAEVNETFRFICPNNPAGREKTRRRLWEMLEGYPFDGVFLDKIRFPSPANGLDEVLSCFCEHCRRAAAAAGLDLLAVARSLDERLVPREAVAASRRVGRMRSWLDELVAGNPLLSEFLRFRCTSITRLVAEMYAEGSRRGRKVALDLFSPGLAPLVGQDYLALSQYCAWAKPMTYRIAMGPAGLRLEIPALVAGFSKMFGFSESEICGWASLHVPGFESDTLRLTRETAVPLPLMAAEMAEAVGSMRSVPVYYGLELVSHPGVIDITPSLVNDMVHVGRAAGAAGTIISWDLMHAPVDGIEALAAAMQGRVVPIRAVPQRGGVNDEPPQESG
jgi:hypothetical protein